MSVLKAVEEVNEKQKSVMFKKVKAHFGEDLSALNFAVWGLSFKPKTDDMREAPSVVIIKALLKAGAKVRVFDPVAMEEAKHDLKDSIVYAKDEYDALIDADALLLITVWPEFRVTNFDVIERLMKQKVVFDGRNIYDKPELKALGYAYYGIGI